jgi:hypothetical protein
MQFQGTLPMPSTRSRDVNDTDPSGTIRDTVRKSILAPRIANGVMDTVQPASVRGRANWRQIQSEEGRILFRPDVLKGLRHEWLYR